MKTKARLGNPAAATAELVPKQTNGHTKKEKDLAAVRVFSGRRRDV